MQTTANTGLAKVDRITAAAHATNQRVAMPSIIAYDYRIRGWTRANKGDLTSAPTDFAVVSNASAEVVRARIVSGALNIQYAAIGISLEWSSNVAPTVAARFSVALNGHGTNALECYFVGDDLKVKRTTSSNGGHSWTTPTEIYTFGGVGFLSSPAANLVLISDISASYLQLRAAIYSGGAWTVTAWDYSDITAYDLEIYGLPLSVSPAVTTISLGDNEYGLAFCAAAPRGHQNDGIYTMSVANLTAGQTPHWGQLQSLFTTNPGLATVAGVTYPTLKLAFPKLQVIGSEYWLTALEVSGYAGNDVQHLCYFRSTDGKHWTARQYLAGSDMTYTHNSTPYAFTASDLLYGQVITHGNYVYLFGYDQVWYAKATKLCGVDNPAMRADITNYVVPPLSISESGAGQSASVSITLENPGGVFNNSSILRRGAVIEIALGYHTTDDTQEPHVLADETMPVIKLLVDEVRQPTAISDNEIENRVEIQARNLIKLMQDDADKPDIFYSYESPAQTNLTPINDMTALNVFNGTWMTVGGEMNGGLIDAGSTYVDNLAALAHLRGEDGFCEIKFKSVTGGAWTKSYVGIAFQITDNQNYYAVLFNYANDGGKTFGLYHATPGTNGKVVTYALVDAITGQTRSTTLGSALTIGTPYYLRVQQWHNRVMAFYSTDQQTWTKVIDYAGAASGNSGVTSGISYWGVIQKGNVSASTPFGEPDQAGNALDYLPLNDRNPYDLGRAMSYFMRVRTGKAGILRSISLWLCRVSDNPGSVPDTIIQLWNDRGDGLAPASLTESANKLFESSVPASSINGPLGGSNLTFPWTSVSVDEDVPVAAETYYWVCVKAAANMTLSNSRMVSMPNGLMYRNAAHVASHGGFKVKFQYNIYDASYDPATFYPPIGEFDPSAIYTEWGLTGGAGSAPCLFITTSFDASGIVIQGIQHSGGEFPQTMEHIAQDLCVKAGITGWEPDAWLDDDLATFNVGADSTTTAYTFTNNQSGTWASASSQLTGYHATNTSWALVRSNTYWGERGDGVVEVDMTILAASKRAGVLWRAYGSPATGLTYAYLVDVSTATTPMVTLSKIISGTVTTLYSTPSLVPIPTNAPFKLTVLSNAGMIGCYVNECLAGVFWDVNVSGQGSVGLAVLGHVSNSVAAKFANLRVPDVWKVKHTFDVAENSSWQSALNNLIGKDRIGYFVRANGAMRLSSFARRDSDPTAYDSLAVRCTKIDSDRYWASHIRPEGGRFADRFDATLLDSDGRRFRKEDYTDAYTDEQAYDDAAVPLRAARERTVQYEMESACVPAAELEDVITLTNPLDGTTAQQFIINDRTITFDLPEEPSDQLVFTQTLGLRSFID